MMRTATLAAAAALLGGCAFNPGASYTEIHVYGSLANTTVAGNGCSITRGLQAQRQGDASGEAEVDAASQSGAGAGALGGGIANLFTSAADCAPPRAADSEGERTP